MIVYSYVFSKGRRAAFLRNIIQSQRKRIIAELYLILMKDAIVSKIE